MCAFCFVLCLSICEHGMMLFCSWPQVGGSSNTSGTCAITLAYIDPNLSTQSLTSSKDIVSCRHKQHCAGSSGAQLDGG
jgi:hypothetical protein